jgi:hypothetical protein
VLRVGRRERPFHFLFVGGLPPTRLQRIAGSFGDASDINWRFVGSTLEMASPPIRSPDGRYASAVASPPECSHRQPGRARTEAYYMNLCRNADKTPITDAHLTPQLQRLRARQPSLFNSPAQLQQWVDDILDRIASTLPGWSSEMYPPLAGAGNPLPPHYVFLNPPVLMDGQPTCVLVMAGHNGTSTPVGTSRDRGYLKVALLGRTHPCTTYVSDMHGTVTPVLDKTPIFEFAHRFVLWAMDGPPPDGLPQVMHTCNNKPCLTLFHLKYGSAFDNHPSRN